jgi:integrase
MLERNERPQIIRREKRILRAEEIAALLRATPRLYLPIIATAIFTGLRLSELLGLVWGDVDLESGLLYVRRQLDRSGNYTEPKTRWSLRTVGLAPSLVRLLAEHKRASNFNEPTDSVFATGTGRPMYYRNVTGRGLAAAVARAQLNKPHQPRLRFHDLRHTYTSLLIAQGINVIYVSRQLGHAYPGFTLNTYGGLFERAEHADLAAKGIEAVFPPGL